MDVLRHQTGDFTPRVPNYVEKREDIAMGSPLRGKVLKNLDLSLYLLFLDGFENFDDNGGG